MLSNEPNSEQCLEENSGISEVIKDHSISSSVLPDSLLDTVVDILNRYSILLDTTSYPASLYAESILYMVYWFHRLRDPLRKDVIEDYIGKYLQFDSRSTGVKALLSDPTLKFRAKDVSINASWFEKPSIYLRCATAKMEENF
jgi:hypothetical protein